MIEMESQNPTWTRKLLAIVALLLCISAMGAGVWWGFFRDPNRPREIADATPMLPRGGGQQQNGPPQGRGQGQQAQAPARTGWRALMPRRTAATVPVAPVAPAVSAKTDGVRPVAGTSNEATVRAGGVRMHVLEHATPSTLSFTIKTSFGDIVLATQQDVLQDCRLVLDNKEAAERINLTAEQAAKLKAVVLPDNSVSLDAAGEEKFRAMYVAYESATDAAARKDAETRLVAELKALGNTQASALKAKVTAAVNQIQSILTPEQIQSLKGWAPTPKVQATTKPV